ncbi:MAG: hypothetical protein Q8N23_18840 [Archangium sp.]|nr:hypothetical protein [Archangium sp.]MDP3154742.1 hypothetical protein [Archangium sp.]MDP3573632.1 hypothetical protein [Archangium sp.]
MSDFMIESPHTKEECLHALDETLAAGPGVLAKYEFGCTKGDHTGYALVSVETEREARLMVPEFLREKAKVIEVAPYTPEEIRAFHQ